MDSLYLTLANYLLQHKIPFYITFSSFEHSHSLILGSEFEWLVMLVVFVPLLGWHKCSTFDNLSTT